MSNITLPWDNSTMVVPFIQTDALNTKFYKRLSDATIELNVRHSPVKRKSATGSVVYRHNVELVFTRFAVGDTPAIPYKLYFVIEVQEDCNEDNLKTLAGSLGRLMADANFVNALLGLQSGAA